MAVKITCDICKKEESMYKNMSKLTHRFGYGSKHDGENLEMDICEDCLVNLFEKYIEPNFEVDDGTNKED